MKQISELALKRLKSAQRNNFSKWVTRMKNEGKSAQEAMAFCRLYHNHGFPQSELAEAEPVIKEVVNLVFSLSPVAAKEA